MSDNQRRETDRLSRKEKVQKAVELFRAIRQRHPLPADIRFDREEANSRDRKPNGTAS